MSNLEKAYQNTKIYISRIHRSLLILEVFIGLVTGGLIGVFLAEGKYLLYLLVSVLFYLLTLTARFQGQRFFPESLFEELKSKDRIQILERDLARKDSIYRYFSISIQALNKQTCKLEYPEGNSFCDQSVREGLLEVLSPLVNNPQYILNCNKSQFSVGIISQIPYISPDLKPEHNPYHDFQCVLLRDDLNISPNINKNTLVDCKAAGEAMHIRNVLQQANNETEFASGRVNINGKNCFLCASPIPQVCEGGQADGVMFVATECFGGVPSDTGDVMLVFSRVVSNWVSKYVNCMYMKLQTNSTEDEDKNEDGENHSAQVK